MDERQSRGVRRAGRLSGLAAVAVLALAPLLACCAGDEESFLPPTNQVSNQAKPETGKPPDSAQKPGDPGKKPDKPDKGQDGRDWKSPAPAPVAAVAPADGPFAGISELTVEVIVGQVLARSPTLDQMVAAWQAAKARYPQVTSLEDPMLGLTIGPSSIGSSMVDFAYRVEVSQKIPYPGKRELRGAQVLAEANAAGKDIEDMRLQLAESARMAFYDYYLAARALEVNARNLKLLEQFKGNAETRYKTGVGQQQDILQAQVEIGRQRERLLTLQRMQQVARARINTLMHLPPQSPLPPPPETLPPGSELPDAESLRSAALARRPDLIALAARIAAEEAGLRLAQKEYYPDFDFMAAYDAFWQRPEQDLRTMLAVRFNLPVRHDRRLGMIAEALAKVAQRRAELARQTDQVNFEVEQSYQQVHESEKIVVLYEKELLPAAEANVKAAQTAYVTGKVPFLNLVEAQRGLVELRDRSYEATTEVYRWRATLERVLGVQAPALPTSPGTAPGQPQPCVAVQNVQPVASPVQPLLAPVVSQQAPGPVLHYSLPGNAASQAPLPGR